MDELQQAFVHESGENLELFEDTLLRLENNPEDHDAINALFRAAHTIKGAAGVVECHYIVAFTHVVENVLDDLRDGKIGVNPDLIALLLSCKDHIGALLGVFAAEAEGPSDELKAKGDEYLARLRDFLPKPDEAETGGHPVEYENPVETMGGGMVESNLWHVSVRFGRDVLKKGMDPLSFLRYLATLGEISHITTLFDAMPDDPAAMDPESCYLGFEIGLHTTADRAAIARVFDFVQDDCVLHILPPNSKISEYVAIIDSLPEDTMRLGEILVKSGALTERELEEGLKMQGICLLVSREAEAENMPYRTPPIGEILIEQSTVPPELIEAATAKQAKVTEKKTQEAKLVRVQADKLDRLINLVGELVIAGAGANVLANRSGDGALQEATSLISRLVEEIRDGALRLRMVQIGETFNRFQRVVRDTSRELSKEIDLIITGADTELDKTVVEKIGDPLMHLVRNSMDHGLERPEVRTANGKPARGTLRLNAYHDSGSIVIEVMDDGAGLNRDKILNKAVERGIVSAEQNLSDREIYQLIFEPGFSTADQVSNLSGRGVGMDVVRRNIESLRGTIELESSPGQGTTTRIRLPLTLAIIDGFLVGVADAAYVIPLDMVLECVELSEADRQAANQRSYVNLRGEVLPFVRLRDHFEHEAPPAKRENIVVVQYAGQKAGIVVDELMGEFQTVIKPLGRLFAHLKGIGGSTILGTGEVALILDVPAMIQRAASNENRVAASLALAASPQ
jgi:two-component system chemotaxis sensor kinase CheA